MKTFLKFSFLFISLFISPLYAQWQQMNSPLATPDIRFIAHHPDGYLIALSNLNEVFRSDSMQNNWNKIATLDSSIKCLTVSNDGVIYAGTKKGYLFSTDLGLTWQAKQLMQWQSSYISEIKFNSLGHIFMNHQNEAYNDSIGVFISTDHGDTWVNHSVGLLNELGYSIGIEIDSSGNIYFATPRKIFKSIDNGTSWQLLTSSNDIIWDFKLDSDNNFYIISYISPLGYTISKSTNYGNSWQELYSGNFLNLYISHNLIFAFGNSLMPDESNLVYSPNEGSTWLNIGIPKTITYDLFLFDDEILFNANSRGLRKSFVNEINWSLSFKCSDRFISINDFKILINNKWSIGTNEGLYTSTNNGFSWDSTSILDFTRLIQIDKLDNIYAIAGYLYRSSDNGVSWEIPYEASSNFPHNINNIFINDSNYIFLNEGIKDYGISLQKSIDTGNSWYKLWSFYTTCDQQNISYSFLENNTGTYFLSYYLKYQCYPYPVWSIYKRILKKENNSGWTQIMENVAYNMYELSGVIYFATADGIYKSTDSGNSFVQINNGLNSLVVTQLILDPEVFIALTGSGIYRSLDQGNYWTQLDQSGLNSSVNRIYYDDYKNLYACTQNGLFLFTGVLPVELLSFTSNIDEDFVTLNWSTATELNNQGFEIQRKLYNSDWITIGFIQGNGTTSNQSDYSYTDLLQDIQSREINYRLKQINFNGTYEYSNEICVSLTPIEYNLFQNYPNPFNPTTKISYQLPKESKVVLRVYDILGSEIATIVNEYQDAGYKETDFDASSLSSGIYVYKISAGDFVSSKKMIVAK